MLIDLVPNHSSDRHPRFQSALAAGPGSAERELYIFRDGAGSNGTPPNNWPAMFGGGAWERTTNPDGSAGQWYPTLTWDDDVPDGVLSFTREPGFRCVVNIGPEPYEVPADAEVLISRASPAHAPWGGTRPSGCVDNPTLSAQIFATLCDIEVRSRDRRLMPAFSQHA